MYADAFMKVAGRMGTNVFLRSYSYNLTFCSQSHELGYRLLRAVSIEAAAFVTYDYDTVIAPVSQSLFMIHHFYSNGSECGWVFANSPNMDEHHLSFKCASAMMNTI